MQEEKQEKGKSILKNLIVDTYNGDKSKTTKIVPN